ncbi:hypothetical protein VitviT2T_021964 [Vitis vinifera]|uniref:Tetraspanin-8 n=2 Tax=Vitis vinifera TaxID=29760 RepID=A0A438EAP1_VITVI|nr:Tetraspanin-8 [Vitis vinifera]RVX06433.1 Tetraspanin-8 [Vitis vinifera]WKA03882.1 hypothetical protein VitviT2T_021964 [Vitis vinifera]
MSASRGCLIFTNLLTFLASIIIVASALLIRFYGQTKCSGYVQGPILVIGIVLFVVSLIGMIGSCCRLTSVLCVYLCVMLFVVIGLLSFTLVAIAVLPMSNQKDASSEGLSPLQEHSYLLRNNLIDEHQWVGIKSCLSETKICSGSEMAWTRSKALSPVKVGCCRPPSYCGYDLMNSTFWPVVRTSMHNSEFNDCRTWKNEPNVMCYDCDSCKAGFLARIRNDWMKITTVINFLIAYLIINFLIGCCAFRSSVIADQRYRDYS